MILKWLIAAAVLYGGFVALLYLVQRSLQYFPERRRTAPQAAGLPEAEEAVLDTADGERVIVWHVPPREDGGSSRFHRLIAALLAISRRLLSDRDCARALPPIWPTFLTMNDSNRVFAPLLWSCFTILDLAAGDVNHKLGELCRIAGRLAWLLVDQI